jgi:NAD(P)-dependent dehydrogenase (short-subunit alcohol dehydrogenase family)
MEFSGKTVVITGAGSGIGRAFSIGFTRDGAHVIGIGRSEADLAQTVSLCAPGRMQHVSGDVGREEDVLRLFELADRLHGRVDILVNNAAQYPKLRFLDSTMVQWNDVVRTNVMGMAMCCHAALPGMLERGFGRIVNIGTFAWMGPIADSSAYSATKAAVRPFTKALAAEIDRQCYPDVLINELIPGVVRTRMSDNGEEPSDIYRHVRFVAALPRGGPTGSTFVQSQPLIEDYGLRARLKRWVGQSRR